jgi:Lactate racemase N-terminal domain
VRVPLLSGTQLVVVDAPDDAVVLVPPEPVGQAITDVGAAVRDAVRFPLSGAPLAGMVPRDGRSTIVTDVPALPLPSAPVDARRAAIGAAVQELRNLGIPDERQTIVVTAGLGRRPGRRELDRLFAPAFARAFYGQVHVHDAEDPDLVELAGDDSRVLRVARSLVDTDIVVCVSAAETVVHGGPGVLLACSDAETQRDAAATAASLLEASGSHGWRSALGIEAVLARRAPLFGVSLALDQPRIAEAAFGYPYDPRAAERIAASRAARLFRWLPGAVRLRVIRSLPVSITAAGAFAGLPSVAHAEALLRSIELRSIELDQPLDAICLGIPRTTPYLPRERPNPLLAAYLGLGLALRLWRARPPVADGGTVILLHRFHRRFAHPTQLPYRAFFQATRAGLDPQLVEQAERAAVADERALDRYRAGRTCHPVLPYADWQAIRMQTERLGTVIVGGCRDAAGARHLGFVPARSAGAALSLALGLADDGGAGARIGFLLAPPYSPIRVGS